MYQATTSEIDISAPNGARKLRFGEDVLLSVLYKRVKAFVITPSRLGEIRRVVVASLCLRVQQRKS